MKKPSGWTESSEMNNNKFVFSPETDFLKPDEIRAVQTRYLRSHLQYCKKYSPFYRKLLRNIPVGHVTPETLKELPFTTKPDISARQDDFIACSWDEIQDVVFSSGTTGEPCRIVYTGSDMERTAFNEQRSLSAAGITKSDRVLLTCTLDRCFIAGMAYFMGLRKIGAAAIRNGLCSIESHVGVIQRLKPTAVIGVASFLRNLGEELQKRGVDNSGVRLLICVGEPLRDETLQLNSIGRQLQERWKGARLVATYASSEIATSFCECPEGCGGHLLADLAYLEVVDEQGNNREPGEVGEIVVTPMRATAMPLIRYRTGDVGFMMTERCACGRYTPRLGPILGRKAQMLKCKGTSIYPQVIFNVLMSIPQVAEYYVVAGGEDLSDTVEVFVAFNTPGGDLRIIEESLQAKCRLNIPVREVPLNEARELVFGINRKPQHFFDRRR
ncbi:MAG: Phenylacetate-coenzyme A ligase [Lentisphaerae bacterium ADurb.Bin242]|nr:MAG: Phenylacetate-coenzyme A ligase [Lentisphaerae bacterium ADurb.Bin242]